MDAARHDPSGRRVYNFDGRVLVWTMIVDAVARTACHQSTIGGDRADAIVWPPPETNARLPHCDRAARWCHQSIAGRGQSASQDQMGARPRDIHRRCATADACGGRY